MNLYQYTMLARRIRDDAVGSIPGIYLVPSQEQAQAHALQLATELFPADQFYDIRVFVNQLSIEAVDRLARNAVVVLEQYVTNKERLG